MILQIPELGVVAIGNQVGRVMLLTMTKSAEYPCGFRVECILPLKSEEEKEHRPEVALMGMAVAPIQGKKTMNNQSRLEVPNQDSESLCESFENPRRYRLFLIYCNHTVLSYEITLSLATNEVGVWDYDQLP